MKRKKKNMYPYGFFSQMSDKEFTVFMRRNYKGVSQKELWNKCHQAYNQMHRRKLADEFDDKKIIVRQKRSNHFFRGMPDTNLKEFVRGSYKEYTISELEEKDATVLSELRRRDILEDLVKDGTLIRMCKPTGFFSEATDEELADYVKTHYGGKTITELEEETGGGPMGQLRSRGLIDKLVDEGVLTRVHRKKKHIKNMSNGEFVEFMRQENMGKSLTELAKTDMTTYREMGDRELKEKLIADGIITRRESKPKQYFSKMSDDEIVDYIKAHYHGKTIQEFRHMGGGANIYVDKRGLMKRLVEEGIIVRQRIYTYDDFTDDEIKDMVKKDYFGMEISKFALKKGALNNEVRSRGLLQDLIEKGILKKADRRKYKMSDEEFVEFLRENYSGLTCSQLGKSGRAAYREVNKRGLMDDLVREGIIIRKKMPTRYRTSIEDDEAYRKIVSLGSVSDDYNNIANLLIQIWPSRFPSASELAKSLPGAVKRIGYALSPFTMEKAAGYYDEDFGLPSDVRYSLDSLLLNIARDQYQKPFNSDPEGTLLEINDYAVYDSGVQKLAKKTFDYYKSVYNFKIPGHENLGEGA